MDCWQQVKQQLQQLLQQQWEHHHVVDEDDKIIQYQFDLIIQQFAAEDLIVAERAKSLSTFFLAGERR